MADGVRIEVKGAEEALGTLSEAVARTEHPRDLFDAIGASLVVSTQRRFEIGEDPDGSPWPASIRVLLQGGRTLIDTANLLRSITHEASDAGVAVGTDVAYAATHQFGATIRPVRARSLVFRLGGANTPLVFAREVTIPARPFLGLDAEDEEEIEAIAADWLIGDEESR